MLLLPLNRVDSKFSWCIRSCLNKHHSIGTIKPAYLKVVFMREHIGKIQVACNPVYGYPPNPIWSNTIFNYWLEFSAIWSNTENAIPHSSVKLNPVDPVLGIMHINMEDVVTWKQTLAVTMCCRIVKLFNNTDSTAQIITTEFKMRCSTKSHGQVVSTLVSYFKVAGSNLGSQIGNINWGFHGFLQSLWANSSRFSLMPFSDILNLCSSFCEKPSFTPTQNNR